MKTIAFDYPVYYFDKGKSRVGSTRIEVPVVDKAPVVISLLMPERNGRETGYHEYRAHDGELWRRVDFLGDAAPWNALMLDGGPAEWAAMDHSRYGKYGMHPLRIVIEGMRYGKPKSTPDIALNDCPAFRAAEAALHEAAKDLMAHGTFVYRVSMGPVLTTRQRIDGVEPRLAWAPDESATNAPIFSPSEIELAREVNRAQFPRMAETVGSIHVDDKGAAGRSLTDINTVDQAFCLAFRVQRQLRIGKSPEDAIEAAFELRLALERMFPNRAFNWSPQSFGRQWGDACRRMTRFDASGLIEPMQRVIAAAGDSLPAFERACAEIAVARAIADRAPTTQDEVELAAMHL